MQKTKNNKITKCAMYARVSTQEQAMHGYSIDAQLSALRKYAIDHDYKIVDEYVDAGVSGAKFHRPELDRLMSDLDQIDIILFVRLDRWSRKVYDYHRLQEQLDQHGVVWNAITESYNTEDAQGRFTTNVMMSAAEQERDRTSERIKFVNAKRKADGYMTNASVPIWFKRVKTEGGYKCVVDDPDQIRECIQYAIEHGKEKACTEFNITRRKLNILINTPYLDQIYTDEDLLSIRKRLNAKTYERSRVNLFGGLMICPSCGYKLHVKSNIMQNGKWYQYYRCERTRPSHGSQCDHTHAYSEIMIEKDLLRQIESAMKTPVTVSETPKKKKKKSQSITASKKIDRLNELYIEGKISRDEYDKRYLQYTNEIIDLSEPSEKPSERRFDSDVLSIYQSLDRSQKRDFWHQIIESMTPTSNSTVEVRWCK